MKCFNFAFERRNFCILKSPLGLPKALSLMDWLSQFPTDLVLILSRKQDPTGLAIFNHFLETFSIARIISPEGKSQDLENPQGKVTAIDSFFVFCIQFTHGNDLASLNRQLRSYSPILALMGQDLMQFLHPAIQAFIQTKASIITIDQDSIGYSSKEQESPSFSLRIPTGPKKGIFQYSIASGIATSFKEVDGHKSRILSFICKVNGREKNTLEGKSSGFTDLSFNVELNDKQRDQKDSLILPYWSAKGDKPVISYYHEKEDDFDEEDPDADLDL